MSNKARLLLVLKGALIGLSDSVPGVSGGTIALLTGVYARLLAAISSADIKALRLLTRGDLAGFWLRIDGSFLACIALGMLAGLLLSANTVLYALEVYPIPLAGFFMGLVLGAIFLLHGQFRLRGLLGPALFAAGAALVAGLLWLEPGQTATSNGELLLAGAIAICGMLLPGLSGAFLLILLGVYERMLEALVGFEWVPIFFFVMGCALGLALFSRFLTWLLRRFAEQTITFIGGLLLGSLMVIWPWRLDDQAQPLLPWDYAVLTGAEPQQGWASLALVAGFLLVVAIERLFRSREE